MGETTLNTGDICERKLKESLLKSAWRHVYDGLNIKSISSAQDRRKFEQGMASPAAFTLDNIRAMFGDYLTDPRGNILRGLAEVFCNLDPAYKSHEKVKIGVQGLPKRIILSGCVDYFHGWGADKIRDILNALAAYQRKPLVTQQEMRELFKREDALLETQALEIPQKYGDPEVVKLQARA